MTDTRTDDSEPDDVLHLDEADQIDDDGGDDDQQPGDDESAEFVGFDDEPATAPADTDLVRHLRQQIRDRDKRLAQTQPAAEQPIVVGAKPTLEGCDFDADRYETERDAWDDRRIAADKQTRQADEANRTQQEQWAMVTRDYATKKAALRYPDVQQAEETTLNMLSGEAQAVIAMHADNNAFVVYALGKSPSKLAELARIDAEGNRLALVKAVTKFEMEAALKQGKTTARPPNPDRPLRGNKSPSAAGDKNLEKLREAAAKSGDRSKVAAYMAAQRKK